MSLRRTRRPSNKAASPSKRSLLSKDDHPEDSARSPVYNYYSLKDENLRKDHSDSSFWADNPHEEKKEEDAPPSSCALSPSFSSHSSRAPGPRIARLASLFSSRAVVVGPSNKQITTTTTVSKPPRRSQSAPRRRLATEEGGTTGISSSASNASSSSAGLAWPGTVDKRGRVYQTPSQEDDRLDTTTTENDTTSSNHPLDSSGEPSAPLQGYRNPREVVTPRKYNESGAIRPRILSKTSLSSWKYQNSQKTIKGEQESNPASASQGVAIATRYLMREQERQQQKTSQESVQSVTDRSYTHEIAAWPDEGDDDRFTEASSAYMEVESSYESFGPQQEERSLFTEENLRKQNELNSPPHRTFPASPGYRGLLDKTKDVPSLMDVVDHSDDASSSKATSVVSGRRIDFDTESDIFDGISLARESDVFDNLSSPRRSMETGISRSSTPGKQSLVYPERIAEEGEETAQNHDSFNMVILGGGLTTIQTTNQDYSIRKTASQYDENLSNSDVDQYGFSRTPGFNEMLESGKNNDSSLLGISGNFSKSPRKGVVEIFDDDESSDFTDRSSLFTDPYESTGFEGDLAKYYIPQSTMKILIRKYRQCTERVDPSFSFDGAERVEDETKAFALFEMRSRIMEKDIERGLERRGGTAHVDDLVLTNYYRSAHRIRDAMIVAKAWRDGANPQDVVNTDRLTQGDIKTFFIRRVRYNGYFGGLEPRLWVDDTDFMQYKCASLGARFLHGFEMFTVGDCQSLLLKMTNERCMELREELNDATRRQLEAEDEMRAETGRVSYGMTQAELDYISSMEEVKIVSKKLVAAEKAFALVRDRIEKLISRYESLLVKIENDSFAGASSVVTQESSYVSSEYWRTEEERERAAWARRARRAELRAEVAAREAMLAKQQARLIREEKERELEELKQKLLELQSESSQNAVEREHSVVLARNIASQRGGSFIGQSSRDINRQNIEDVKQKFRERTALRDTHRMRSPVKDTSRDFIPSYGASPKPKPVTPSPQRIQRNNILRLAGEEMYQHLDFYERSLKAVDESRIGY